MSHFEAFLKTRILINELVFDRPSSVMVSKEENKSFKRVYFQNLNTPVFKQLPFLS